MVVPADGTLTLAPRRVHKLRAAATALLCAVARSKRFVDFRALRSFAGLAASSYAYCQYANLFTCCIYDNLAIYTSEFGTSPGFSLCAGLRGRRVKLHKSATKELRFWAHLTTDDCTAQLITPCAVSALYADALHEHWGAVCNGVSVFGFFPEAV